MCEHTCYTHTHSRAFTRRARSFVRIEPLILWCVFNVGKEKWHGITYGSWVPSNGGERCSPLSFFLLRTFSSVCYLQKPKFIINAKRRVTFYVIFSRCSRFTCLHCFHLKIEWNVRHISKWRCSVVERERCEWTHEHTNTSTLILNKFFQHSQRLRRDVEDKPNCLISRITTWAWTLNSMV